MPNKTTVLICLIALFASRAYCASEALQIFVSIPPQQFLVKSIGGERVEVTIMLKPGDTPETFDPTLKQIAELNRSHLYFRIGVAFENKWLQSINKRSKNIKIIDCCENVVTNQALFLDKHVWTSVRNAQRLATVIKQELVKLDQQHAKEYERNYLRLIVQLKQLDNEIHAVLEKRRTDSFIISHAAFGHFAADYGLKQLSLESNGRQPGAKGLVNLVEQARSERIKTLFVQKQHKNAAALAFANEIEAKIVEIDPLREDYVENLRSIAIKMAEAMQ
jgi:zinc transport system substrate-binding protein